MIEASFIIVSVLQGGKNMKNKKIKKIRNVVIAFLVEVALLILIIIMKNMHNDIFSFLSNLLAILFCVFPSLFLAYSLTHS